MKVTLDIRDFQSIQDAHLEFEPGITVITGSTNSGKTAIFRSILSLLNNPGSAKHDIHHEKKQSEVILSVEGQPPIKWVRTPSKVTYVIGDGKPNEKCGKADVWSLLPQFPIQPEPDGQLLNFHTEFDTLFPFGYSYQELFKVFERVMALDDTAGVLKAMNDDLSRVTLLRRHCNVSKLNKAVVVEEEQRAIEAIEALAESASEDSTANSLLVMNERLNVVRQEAVRFRESDTILGSILPYLHILDHLHMILCSRKDLDLFSEKGIWDGECEGKGIGGSGNQVFKDCCLDNNRHDPVPAQSDSSCDKIKPTSLSEKAQEIKQQVSEAERTFKEAIGFFKATSTLAECEKKESLLADIPEAPKVDLEPLGYAKNLVELLSKYNTLSNAQTLLETIPEAPRPVSDVQYRESLALVDSFREYERLVKLIEQIDEKISAQRDCLAFLNEEIAKYDTCELCGAPISEGRYQG